MRAFILATATLALAATTASAQSWSRERFPYAERFHAMCQEKAHRLYEFERRSGADGRLSARSARPSRCFSAISTRAVADTGSAADQLSMKRPSGASSTPEGLISGCTLERGLASKRSPLRLTLTGRRRRSRCRSLAGGGLRLRDCDPAAGSGDAVTAGGLAASSYWCVVP